MSETEYPTPIHRRVALAQRGENPAVVGRVASGWVVLADDQRLRGYCLLLADPVVEHLNALEAARRAQFLADMAAVGDAVLEVCRPSIINYAILGNVDRALHAHIHPRYDSEPAEMRRGHPLRYQSDEWPAVAFDAARDGELMEGLRGVLKRNGSLAI